MLKYSNIETPTEVLVSINEQHDDPIIRQFIEKYIDILTYKSSWSIDKLVIQSKRRAEFLLNNNDKLCLENS